MKFKELKNIKSGAILTFKDEQTLHELADKGQFVTHVDYTANEVLTFSSDDLDFSYKFISLKERDDLYFVVALYDNIQKFDYFVCFVPNEDLMPDVYTNFVNKHPWIEDAFFYDSENVKFVEKETFVGDNCILTEYNSDIPTENPLVFLFRYGNLESDSGGMTVFLNGVFVTDNDVRINFLGEE